ncbi:hypothetical protein AK95_28680 [Paenibacillus sp. LC231]|nr:hypothetical protein AK95_28680 [Paenibacillus sp. LC231]
MQARAVRREGEDGRRILEEIPKSSMPSASGSWDDIEKMRGKIPSIAPSKPSIQIVANHIQVKFR